MSRTTLTKSLALVALVIAMLAATVAVFAAGRDSITLNPTLSAPKYGGTVSFSLVTSQPQPWVSVECRQNGALVYQQSHAYYVDPNFGGPFTDFVLATNTSLDNYTWNGGGASCTATLWYINKQAKARNLASTSFNVLP